MTLVSVRCVLLIVVLAVLVPCTSVLDLESLGYTHELSSNGSQLKVPTHATGENETIRFQMCRTDNYTHFSVVVGKGSGPVYIGNARVDYPVYKKKDLTVTYNQEWFPDKFCKRVSIYINGGVLENGTILQFGLYQQINQTNPDIVGNVTVLLTEGDNNSGAKGSPMPAFTPFIALILWGCMWWILAWLIPG